MGKYLPHHKADGLCSLACLASDTDRHINAHTIPLSTFSGRYNVP